MTPFASVSLIKRNGSTVFRPPRKERPNDATQARKSASRHWRRSIADGDTLVRIFVVREREGRMEIAEQTPGAAGWTSHFTQPADAAKLPHIAACMAELGIDPNDAPPVVPDVLEINGFIYRREI